MRSSEELLVLLRVSLILDLDPYRPEFNERCYQPPEGNAAAQHQDGEIVFLYRSFIGNLMIGEYCVQKYQQNGGILV